MIYSAHIITGVGYFMDIKIGDSPIKFLSTGKLNVIETGQSKACKLPVFVDPLIARRSLKCCQNIGTISLNHESAAHR